MDIWFDNDFTLIILKYGVILPISLFNEYLSMGNIYDGMKHTAVYYLQLTDAHFEWFTRSFDGENGYWFKVDFFGVYSSKSI